MVILGIDPGTKHLGYGLIDYSPKKGINHLLAFGVISPDVKFDMVQKLGYIFQKLSCVIERFKPDFLVMEKAFYSKNVKVALTLGQVRGVVMALGGINSLQFSEYSPKEVKQSVTGNGNASKDQVNYMVAKLFDIESVEIECDASDALAVAFCHAGKLKISSYL